jgi:hypothetical protein
METQTSFQLESQKFLASLFRIEMSINSFSFKTIDLTVPKFFIFPRRKSRISFAVGL